MPRICDQSWRWVAVIPSFVAAICYPYASYAAPSALTSVLCSVVKLAQSDVGAPAATAAVCAMGAMALLGRISWGMLMVTAAGIAIIFSAADILKAITGLASPC